MGDLAAFDFDGTLTHGGSVIGFLSALVGRRTVQSAALVLAPRLAAAALVGGSAADEAKERLFERVLAGVPVDHFEEVSTRYGRQQVERHLRPDVRDRFDWHRLRGDRVVIVSASPAAYVGAAGDWLGADGVIATRLEVGEHGRLTGHYDGRNCRGEEKLRRLRLWVDESGTAPGTTWAYGNSRGDLRLLRAADIGVNVGRLGRLGRLGSFTTLGTTPPDGAGG